jgi:hypothetical protein
MLKFIVFLAWVLPILACEVIWGNILESVPDLISTPSPEGNSSVTFCGAARGHNALSISVTL